MMYMFRNFFSGTWNDQNRFIFEQDEPEWAVDTAASQIIRYPSRAGYAGPVPPQSLNQMPASTMDPLVDYREPRVMEPRVLETRVETRGGRKEPTMIVEPRGGGRMEQPRLVKEVRVDRNQMQPVPLVRQQMAVPGVVEHVHRTLEFRVPLCCEGCQDRVQKHMRHVRGVESVTCDLYRHKVTVHGYAPPNDVLWALRKQFKRTEFWTPEPVIIVRHQDKPHGRVEQTRVTVTPGHGVHVH